jgi:hypothetical protein
MKYLITESRLEENILYYINELFDVNDINWTHPVEYDEETIKKYTNNVETYLTKFKYIFLPANLANFFYGFYVKEYYEDYYLLEENVHLKNGPLNEK